MNRERAQQILLWHRPGIDEADPDETAALALVQHDEELRRWFEAQKSAQAAIRQSFKSIAPPAGLKEQILSERPWSTRPVTARHLVAVATFVIVISVFGFWWSNQTPVEDKSFPAYRARMVSTALRAYGMELQTNNLASIRAYLREHRAPDDFISPAGLAQTTPLGCLTVPWQNYKVAMICFKTDRPLPPGQESDLWFFVITNASVPDARREDLCAGHRRQ